jgi:hypothetical protein
VQFTGQVVSRCGVPLASQSITSLSAQLRVPGTHVPVQAPAAQAKGQVVPGCHSPAPSQVSTSEGWVGEQRRSVGRQTPLQTPSTHTDAHDSAKVHRPRSSQRCAVVSVQRRVPGRHSPPHAPAMQASSHSRTTCQWPCASHSVTERPAQSLRPVMQPSRHSPSTHCGRSAVQAGCGTQNPSRQASGWLRSQRRAPGSSQVTFCGASMAASPSTSAASAAVPGRQHRPSAPQVNPGGHASPSQRSAPFSKSKLAWMQPAAIKHRQMTPTRIRQAILPRRGASGQGEGQGRASTQ